MQSFISLWSAMVGQASARAPGIRPDIQGLRGLAVALVVGGHAFPQYFPAGYIGVDVFFVISGWVIVGMVADAQDSGGFSLSGFWAGRIRRLLPASYAVIALTAAGMGLVGAGKPLAAFGGDAVGALTFTLNFELARQASYFGTATGFSPLLHMWSLSAEEQFYLAIPLLMIAVPREWRKTALFVPLVASLMARHEAWRFLTTNQTFYWPICRAWEPLLGGWLKLAGPPRPGDGLAVWAVSSFLIALVLALSAVADFGVVPASAFHPSGQAMLAAGVAALLLCLQAEGMWAHPLARPWVRLGNASYALYLVHWPVLALWRDAQFATEIPESTAAGLVVVALLLAGVVHYGIEQPCRRLKVDELRWPLTLAAGGGVALAALALWISADGEGTLPDQRHFLPDACAGPRFFDAPECRHGHGKFAAALIGDSLAAHLVPGLEASDPAFGFVQATRGACGPIFAVKYQFAAFDTERTANACLRHNEDVRRWAAAHPEVRLYVLGSAWPLAHSAAGEPMHLYRRSDDGSITADAYAEQDLVAAFAATVRELRRHGARVVLVAPAPQPGFDAGMCAAARARGNWPTRGEQCDGVPLAENRERVEVGRLLGRLAAAADVPVFRFEPWLCRTDRCATFWHGMPLYLDHGHFSAPAFVRLAREIGLARRLDAIAR